MSYCENANFNNCYKYNVCKLQNQFESYGSTSILKLKKQTNKNATVGTIPKFNEES